MRFTTAVLVAVGVLASTCGIAFAGDEEKPKTATEEADEGIPTLTLPDFGKNWYGGQTLTVGGASILVGVGGTVALSNPVPALIGLGGMVLGPPIVHWAHGNVWKGFISLALTTGLSTGAGFVGASMYECTGGDMCGFDAIGYFAIGIAVGGAIAVLLDSMILAWDVPERNVPQTPQPQSRRFEIAPTFALTQQGGGVGVVGRF